MNENHQNETGSKLGANETKIWLPPTFINNKALVASAPMKRGINWGFADRTAFDWTILASQVLGAIAIPFVVMVLGLYLTQQITQQQSQLSASQHQTDLQIAADQQREIILKTCLDDIKDLLLNKSLRVSKPKDEVRVVARVEVLAALRQLDGGRKGLLMLFLSEAGLITKSRNDVIIDLSGANLSYATLSNADLSGATLSNADLSSAILSGAHLNDANLSGATINDADLLGVNLSHATLSHADLSGAYLSGANLSGANLSFANLNGAKLFVADLSHADLSDAILIDADLRYADLSDADLRRDLITKEQLKEAKSLKEATMPDGSKHS